MRSHAGLRAGVTRCGDGTNPFQEKRPARPAQWDRIPHRIGAIGTSTSHGRRGAPQSDVPLSGTGPNG